MRSVSSIFWKRWRERKLRGDTIGVILDDMELQRGLFGFSRLHPNSHEIYAHKIRQINTNSLCRRCVVINYILVQFAGTPNDTWPRPVNPTIAIALSYFLLSSSDFSSFLSSPSLFLEPLKTSLT